MTLPKNIRRLSQETVDDKNGIGKRRLDSISDASESRCMHQGGNLLQNHSGRQSNEESQPNDFQKGESIVKDDKKRARVDAVELECNIIDGLATAKNTIHREIDTLEEKKTLSGVDDNAIIPDDNASHLVDKDDDKIHVIDMDQSETPLSACDNPRVESEEETGSKFRNNTEQDLSDESVTSSSDIGKKYFGMVSTKLSSIISSICESDNLEIPDTEERKSILLDLTRRVKSQVDGCGISSHSTFDMVKDDSSSCNGVDNLCENDVVDFSTIEKHIIAGNIATIYDFERYLEQIIAGVRKNHSVRERTDQVRSTFLLEDSSKRNLSIDLVRSNDVNVGVEPKGKRSSGLLSEASCDCETDELKPIGTTKGNHIKEKETKNFHRDKEKAVDRYNLINEDKVVNIDEGHKIDEQDMKYPTLHEKNRVTSKNDEGLEPSMMRENNTEESFGHSRLDSNSSKNALLELNKNIQAQLGTQCSDFKDIICFKAIDKLIEKGHIYDINDFEACLEERVRGVRIWNMDRYLSVCQQTNMLESYACSLHKAAREGWPCSWNRPTNSHKAPIRQMNCTSCWKEEKEISQDQTAFNLKNRSAPVTHRKVGICADIDKVVHNADDVSIRLRPRARIKLLSNGKQIDYPESLQSHETDDTATNSFDDSGTAKKRPLQPESDDSLNISGRRHSKKLRDSDPGYNRSFWSRSEREPECAYNGMKPIGATDVIQMVTRRAAKMKKVDCAESYNNKSVSSNHNNINNSTDKNKHIQSIQRISEFDKHGENRPVLSGDRNARKSTENYKPVLSKNIPPVDASTPHCCADMSTSVMTPCSSREEWLDLCPQLLMVCNEAARRAALRKNPNATNYDKPLSEVYMRERLQYHDILEGEFIRSMDAPYHFQGFIITTKFTTWRRTLRWTIDSPSALITPRDHRTHFTDRDGSLTAELQKVKRIGCNSLEGYIFDRVREITLLGGLGCGGALMRKTLSTLKHSGDYDFVVLQSTKIAIPFYEKYGFVRVGAVARLLDNDAVSEVAYRHWSEIVDGHVIEPSYMMALRLDSVGDEPVRRPWKVPELSIDERRSDIISSLKSTYSLLAQSLEIRATGSTSYSNTYRELLSTALQFAKSSGDYKLFCAIEACISECVGNVIGNSRKIIQDDLGICKSKKQRTPIKSEGSRSGKTAISPPVNSVAAQMMTDEDTQTVFPPEERMVAAHLMCKTIVNVNITYTYNSKKCSEGKHTLLEASLPNKWLLNMMPLPYHRQSKRQNRDIVVRLDDVTILDNDKDCIDMDSALHANTVTPSPRRNINKVKECEQIAINNLKTFVFKNLCSNARDKTVDVRKPVVELGTKIMIRFRPYIGISRWTEALVEMRCRSNRRHAEDSFIVSWFDGREHMSSPRSLGQYNRGVGREWCTLLDWYSFTALPVTILDALFLESWFDYETYDGNTGFGEVFKRIGAGLNNEPKWRFKLCSSESTNNLGTYYDLNVGILREVVDINDDNYVRAANILNSQRTGHKNFTSNSHENSFNENDKHVVNKEERICCPESPANNDGISNDQIAHQWAEKRMNVYSLLSSNHLTWAKMKRKDDGILAYSTNMEGEEK